MSKGDLTNVKLDAERRKLTAIMSKVIQKVPKRSENGAKMEPKRAKNDPKC